MIGFILGIVCGVIEFFLLMRLVKCIFENKTTTMMLILLSKVVVLAIALLIGAIYLRKELVFVGIGIALPLIVGGILTMILQKKRKERDCGVSDN